MQLKFICEWQDGVESMPYSTGGHTPEERRILSMAYTTLLIKEVKFYE